MQLGDAVEPSSLLPKDVDGQAPWRSCTLAGAVCDLDALDAVNMSSRTENISKRNLFPVSSTISKSIEVHLVAPRASIISA
jgi:hypothetical protein